MAILKTKRAKWIAGVAALTVTVAGTLIGLPTGGTSHNIPLNMTGVTAVEAFAPVTPPGLVPKNVLSALLIPQDSSRTSWRNYDQGNGPYDRQITITVPSSGSSTKTFFSAALKDKAWKLLSSQVVSGNYEILALHQGSDGHFWEVGVTLDTGKPNSSNGVGSSRPTSVALRLLQYQSA